jgi:hypothetical protein
MTSDFRFRVFAAARSEARLVRTLIFSARSKFSLTGCLPGSEFSMSQKTPQKNQSPVSTPVPGRPSIPTPPSPQLQPAEPIEVLGRHKNTGQKDHKGAR